MRLFFMCFCLAIALATKAQLLDSKVNFERHYRGSADSLINQLHAQTGIAVSYSNRVFTNAHVEVPQGTTTVRDVLNAVFSRFPVEYLERTNKIIVAPLRTRYFRVSGFCRDALSSEVLIGANVYDTLLYVGSASNDYGFFSVNVPEGNATLRASFVGYRPLTFTIALHADTLIDVRLMPTLQLGDIEVLAEQNTTDKPRTGTVDIPMEQVKRMPMLLGASDIIKTLQMTPGVHSGEEGFGGMSVRGGAADQNIVLLDDVPLYSPNHLMGLFTVFNSEGINSATLVKSGFPARYGGRMSSVLDVKTKEGNMERYSGYVNVELLASSVMLEGPVVKDRMSFTMSARRTYFDLFAPQLQRKNENKYSFNFYDVTAKLNYVATQRDRLYLSFFMGYDNLSNSYNTREMTVRYTDTEKRSFSVSDEQDIRWGNMIVAARWNHVYGNSLFSNVTASYSRYRFNDIISTYSTSNVDTRFRHDYYSGINDIALRADFTWYTPFLPCVLRFGGSTTSHKFYPGISIYTTNNAQNRPDSLAHEVRSTFERMEHHAYVENELTTKRFSANVGVHMSWLNRRGDAPYVRLEPRVLLSYKAAKNVSFNLAYSDMTQFLQLLRVATVSSPADMWLPVSATPPHSWQVSFETKVGLGKHLEASAEVYYKKFDHIQTYKTNATSTLMATERWEDLYTQGIGDARGVEFFFHKKSGQFSGWVGYALSKAENRFDGINGGQWYGSDYDHRHSASIFTSYKFTDYTDLNVSWSYRTGAPFTLSSGRYSLKGPDGEAKEFHLPGMHNAYQMPASHMLNIGMNIRYNRPRTERVLSFGLYNVYGRKNPMFLYWSAQDGEQEQSATYKLKQFSLIAFPLPYVKYSIKF